MTLNLTPEYYSTSRDFAVITNDAADVAAITALIVGATKSLMLFQEEFSDPGMVSAIQAALKSGVAVTMVQENINGD